MRELKQSATVIVILGPHLDSTDGNSIEDGLTIAQADVRLSKNGGNFAQKDDASNATHDEAGYYSCTLSVIDVSILGHLKVATHITGALAVWNEFAVVDKNYWSSKYSSDIFDVNTIEVGGTVQTALDINDILDDTNELQGDNIPGRLDTLSASVTVIDGIVDDILVDTGELQTDDIPARLDTLSASVTVIDGNVDAILTDTGELQTDDIPARIDTLSGSVSAIPTTAMRGTDNAALSSSLDTHNNNLAIVNGNVNDIETLISGLNDVSPAEVNAEVLDVMNVDTHAEPGTGAPGATVTIFKKIDWMYKSFRNKKRQTATVTELYNDDESTIGSQRTTAGSSSTSTIGEWKTG